VEQLLDVDRYPLDNLQSARGRELVAACRRDLAARGLFNLEGFVRPQALDKCVVELTPVVEDHAFTHRRGHNIYFDDDIAGLDPGHPALTRFETVNHTICADQFPASILCRIYEWPPILEFLAAVMGKDRLFPMEDALARANVLTSRQGEALNWHFDRSEFTTTLLLQAPESGGEFQYRPGLRSEDDPNYDGVARLLADRDPAVKTLSLSPGGLNVFKGKYAAHRVTPVAGPRPRMIAVFSYYETPGVMFSETERLGFYGRAEAWETV
jgi:hypothetical protein